MPSPEVIKAVTEYENYIKRKGVDEKLLEAYSLLSGTAIEDDRSFGLRISARAKLLVADFVKKQTEGGDLWWLEKWTFAHKTEANILNVFYDILLAEARAQIFDSYLLYIERKREPKERFYRPKRKQFLKHGITQAYQGLLDDKYDILCISQPPGTGKAQPLYSKVLTPHGFVRMGDIKVGDIVISGEGNPAKVLGVYPQGIKPIYEVTFDDGSKCRCSDEHLWKVQTRDDRVRKKGYRVVELRSMLHNVKVEKDKRCNYSVDYFKSGVDFVKQELPLPPYFLGAFLGDGCCTPGNLKITAPDGDIFRRVSNELPEGYHLNRVKAFDYDIVGHTGRNSLVRLALKELGLDGKRSYEKFIPDCYKYSTYEDRMELLRGLLDTDGHVDRTGIDYCTSSRQLAEDVCDLVHSVGGYCSINVHTNCGYRDENGDFVKCRDSYRLCIQFGAEHDTPLFERTKRRAYQPKRKNLKRFITSISYVGEEECQCIYIDDPSHLYVTDDYIITHNTTTLKFFNSAVIGWFPKDYNLFYSHSSDITRMYYDGVYQMVTDGQEYTWHDIFPDLKVTSTNAKMQQFNVSSYKPFPSLQTASVGSENAGKVRASKFLLVDDLIGKLEEALNKNTLEKLWGAYTVDARQRRTVDRTEKPCKEVVQATRWSTLDPIGRIIQSYQGNDRVKVISIPDIDPVTGESNFDYEFGGFTKEFFADQALLMDEISYKCLYKQEPIEREGLLYHEDELRRYVTLPEKEPDAILGVCDTKAKGTDYMVLPVMLQYGEDFYMADCICDNSTDFGLQKERLADIICDNAMQQCEFESNAGGDRLAHEVNELVEQKGGRCNITTKATETNKETRIIVNSDWVKKHVLFRDKENYTAQSDYGRFMSQLLSYSIAGRNVHDDTCDALANFALYITRKTRVRTAVVLQSPL